MMAETSVSTPGLLTAGVVSAVAAVSVAEVLAVELVATLDAGVETDSSLALSTTFAVAVASELPKLPGEEVWAVEDEEALLSVSPQLAPPKISAKLY
jgi:hypothetical protein